LERFADEAILKDKPVVTPQSQTVVSSAQSCGQTTDGAPVVAPGSPTSWYEKIAKSISALFWAGPQREPEEFILDYCTYCSAELKDQLKFCLNCGRKVVSPQELVRLRSAQQIFTYPKLHSTYQNIPAIGWSSRSKNAFSRTGWVLGLQRPLFLFNVSLVLLACVVLISSDATRQGMMNAVSQITSAVWQKVKLPE